MVDRDGKQNPSELTRVLRDDNFNYDALIPLVYQDLRAIAQNSISEERLSHTLSATALVHEAFVRLSNGSDVQWNDSSHFFNVAATVMRRVLIDHARARSREKRGGGRTIGGLVDNAQLRLRTPVDLLRSEETDSILSLEAAICRLEQEDASLAQLVQLRYYAGLTNEQVAAAMNISVATVKRRWAFARALLLQAVAQSGAGNESTQRHKA